MWSGTSVCCRKRVQKDVCQNLLKWCFTKCFPKCFTFDEIMNLQHLDNPSAQRNRP